MKLRSHLDSLIDLLKTKSVQAMIIPHQDSHFSEYISAHDKRLEQISGFSGSAGLAIVLTKAFGKSKNLNGALQTDGRYWIQAKQEMDMNRWELMRSGSSITPPPTITEFLIKYLEKGSIVGIDPFLISSSEFKRLKCKFDQAQIGIDLFVNKKSDQVNPIDELWLDQPNYSLSPIKVQTLDLAGVTYMTKIDELRECLIKNKCFALLCTELDQICWLLNLRGVDDIDYNPVFFSYCLITLESVILFIDMKKIDDEVKKHLEIAKVQICSYSDFIEYLKRNIVETKKLNGLDKRIWIDPSTCNQAIYSCFDKLDKDVIYEAINPIVIRKACKNEAELEGMRQCHIRDGAAKVAYLAWLEEQFEKSKSKDNENSNSEFKITEYEAAQKLKWFRKQQENFVGPSFPSISSTGRNAAIVHYHPTQNSCSEIDFSKIYLIDSGGQYLDGTTDVTRTILFDEKYHDNQRLKDCYTRVLRGHIALAKAIFPENLPGQLLDCLARQYLWEVGLNYQHGTGHGVGSYLNVHEGPQRIAPYSASKTIKAEMIGMKNGMVTSNEPGFYSLEEEFGIRIESLMISKYVDFNKKSQSNACDSSFESSEEEELADVKQSEEKEDLVEENLKKNNSCEPKFLEFETITMVPIFTKLIDPKQMSDSDIQWLNDYHDKCFESLRPLLQDKDFRAYNQLQRACLPISRTFV